MSTTARPFSLHIYLPDGTPDGLRLLDKSNWTGRGVYMPRSMLAKAKQREEFGRAGVYVLVGPPEDGDQPRIYVGHAEVIAARLQQHHGSKDFWTRAVFFVSKDGSLNRVHVQYLESRLIDMAKAAKRAIMDNTASPSAPALAEWEQADVESFLADVLSILPLVGLDVFEQPRRARARIEHLYIQAKGISAKGYESGDGFVVAEGSEAVLEEVASVAKWAKHLTTAREQLRSSGVLVVDGDRLRFTQDYEFNSPSMAAGVVQGRSANGYADWRDAQGRSLKELQAEESGADGEVDPAPVADGG